MSVRVVPRSARTEVVAGERGTVIRVRAAPEGGKATAEATAALASALGVPRTAVRLLTGSRSRAKVFAVDGLGTDEVRRRLHPR